MIPDSSPAPPQQVVVLMPLRDDWDSARELIQRLDQAVANVCLIEVLLVDDGSMQQGNRDDFSSNYSAVQAIRILRLRRNLGHQRAISIGLAHIQQNVHCSAVLVMDSDGEDTAEGAVQLLRAYSEAHETKAIFAARSRRSESFVFQCFYQLYRLMHLVLTGIRARVGNFSILPPEYLNTLVAMPEMWNHYAAAVSRSGLPFVMIPISRGKRIAGTSRMNFTSLVAHGLSAISVFGEIVGVRLLIGCAAGSLLAVLGIVLAILIRFFTNQAIPGWTTYVTGTFVIIMIQFLTIATSFTFFTLSTRANLGFVPLRDYLLFVEEIVDIHSNE